MNQTRWDMPCGCRFEVDPLNWHMIRCPLHGAAPDLVKACVTVAEGLERDARLFPDGKFPSPERFVNRAKVLRTAIKKAEGKKGG